MGRLTKKQKRHLQQQGAIDNRTNLKIKPIYVKPITEAQEDAFTAWDDGYNLVLHGTAGTGKTFVALNLAVNRLLDDSETFKKIYIVRSLVPTRDMGYLPGTASAKQKMYEGPYIEICNQLFDRGDAYEILKNTNKIEFMSTAFIRGITLENCIVVVEEIQNMDAMELHSVMTRVGENCNIIFSGDINQNDLASKRFETSGAAQFMDVIDRMVDHFALVQFTSADIVRSALVKEYIIQRESMGL